MKSFFTAVVLVLVLILAGCGSDTTPSQSPDPDNPPQMELDPEDPAPEDPPPIDPCVSPRILSDPSCPDLPSLEPAIYTTRLDQSVTFNIQGSDPLNDRILRDPQQGTVILNADGSVTYSPAPGAVGEDSFEIEISGNPREFTIDNNLAYEGQIGGRDELLRQR